jgi:hypothetical protein
MKNQIIEVFNHLKNSKTEIIRTGGQCSVYELDIQRVLKIYIDTNAEYFQSLVNFQEKIKRYVNKLPLTSRLSKNTIQ